MSDSRYLETIENDYGLPQGEHKGSWYRYDILLENVQGRSYNIRISKHQRTPDVPVTVIVIGNLIDIYLGH